MHVQRMFKMSRVYALAEILSKIFVKKKRKKIGDLIYDQGLTKLTTWCQLKVALTWYGKLTWESAHDWNLIILCL